MRRVLLISLVTFIVVVSAGYCICWYAQATQIKRNIEQLIAKVNEQQLHLTYDAIETSGFPKDIYVSIVKPHFTGRIDTFLKAFTAQMHPGQPDVAQALPEWNEDALLDGRIIVGINAFSDHYSLRVSGNWQRNDKIGDQTLAIVAQSGDSLCTMEMAHSGGIFNSLWDYHALIRDNAKDFLKDLRMIDCNGAANTVSDATSHEKLADTGPWRFYIAHTPQGSAESARFYIKIADAEVLPQGDAMVTLLRSAFSPNFSTPVKYSQFGKQNIEVDFSYIGPTDWKEAGKNPPLDIRLSKFDITNQLYNSTTTFFLSNGMNGAERAARVAFKSESNFSDQYDVLLQDMTHAFVQQLYTGKSQPVPRMQPYVQKYSADELYAIISPAIPNLHSLGKLVQTIDLSYLGNAELNDGDATLTALEISTTPYGITGSGAAKLTAGHPFPAGRIALSCSNCARLVDDVIGYAARLQKTLSYFQPPEKVAAETPMDSRLADGIKTFLKALAEPAKENDPNNATFNYTIVSDGATGATINGKNLSDVMALYNQTVGSLVKTSQPAATPAVTPAPAR